MAFHMIEIIVSNEKQKLRKRHPAGPIEIGRNPGMDHARLVIDDSYVSRSQLIVEQLEEERVQIQNVGANVLLGDGDELARGQTHTARMPIRVSAGFTVIEIAFVLDPDRASHAALNTISRPVQSRSDDSSVSIPVGFEESPNASQLTKWFEALLAVQQSAAGSTEFYHETAEAVVEMINLDRGLVLLRKEDDWEVMGRHARIETDGAPFSRTVLSQVVQERRTFFRDISQTECTQSLIGIEAVVASPVFDANKNVIGAVYGARHADQKTMTVGIRPIEAQLVQLLAAAVSSGLARVKKEEEAARTRVQFEQFFSRKLVAELERNPSLLEGHDREITVLFCDLRKFSLISERLGARQVYELLGEMMDAFTNVVMDHGGIIVDYHGDGLAAMWNAPTNDAQHAQSACAAADTMLMSLRPLDEKWQSDCGFPLSIGIGINSGIARVGNAGSRRRMKYGPLGHTVNLASRLEGVTKILSVPVLITEATRQRLSNTSCTRRLCKVQVVGMESPVAVFEYRIGLPAKAKQETEAWLRMRGEYERALEFYELGEFTAARELLTRITESEIGSNDQPTMYLLDRMRTTETRTPGAFDPVLHMKFEMNRCQIEDALDSFVLPRRNPLTHRM